MLSLRVLILFSFAKLAVSIRCYDCNSANNSMCLDPTLYDRETLDVFLRPTECRHGVQAVAPEGNYDFFCRKIVQIIFHKHSASEVRVTRGCGWQRSHKPCYKADNEDHMETVCQCFTDICNHASASTLSLQLAAIMLGLVVYFRNKFI